MFVSDELGFQKFIILIIKVELNLNFLMLMFLNENYKIIEFSCPTGVFQDHNVVNL